MYPILINWGPVVIPSWHFMYALGAVGAFFFLRWLNSILETPLSHRHIANLFICCYIAGYFGARLLSIIVEQPELHSFAGILSGLSSLGPMTFYGGAIGAFVAGLIYAATAKIPFRDVIDISIPSGLLALGFGRVGCFLNGDDYGSVIQTSGTTPWWAVVFPNLEDGLARYPVQLWEAGAVSIITCALAFNLPKLRTHAHGLAGYLAIALYANVRFTLEFYRGDFRGQPFGGWMSTSQVISLVILVLCAASLPLLFKKTGSPRCNA